MGKGNIILIGMMGAGKTTVANELARILFDYKLYDIDSEIEKSTNRKISEIFLRFGEKHFRILESDKIKQVCKNSNTIISLGGGGFENPDNRDILLNCGKVFYLKASPKEIYNRIKSQTHRPLLQKNFSVERIEQIMKAREVNYKKAHIKIDTDGKSTYDIVKEILGVINA